MISWSQEEHEAFAEAIEIAVARIHAMRREHPDVVVQREFSLLELPGDFDSRSEDRLHGFEMENPLRVFSQTCTHDDDFVVFGEDINDRETFDSKDVDDVHTDEMIREMSHGREHSDDEAIFWRFVTRHVAESETARTSSRSSIDVVFSSCAPENPTRSVADVKSYAVYCMRVIRAKISSIATSSVARFLSFHRKYLRSKEFFPVLESSSPVVISSLSSSAPSPLSKTYVHPVNMGRTGTHISSSAMCLHTSSEKWNWTRQENDSFERVLATPHLFDNLKEAIVSSSESNRARRIQAAVKQILIKLSQTCSQKPISEIIDHFLSLLVDIEKIEKNTSRFHAVSRVPDRERSSRSSIDSLRGEKLLASPHSVSRSDPSSRLHEQKEGFR